MMKFSIVVPVYNVSIYLNQCIDSILKQSYENLEIICIDDGSTDASGQILDEYAKKDIRVRVIHKPNAGYGHTMNLGLQYATGDYIGIVESDDYIAENMYQRLAEVIENSTEQLDFVKASYNEVKNGRIKRRNLFEHSFCERPVNAAEYSDLFSNPCSIWSAVYHREFLKRNEIHFLETPGASYQDTSFWFKVLATANKFVLLEDALLYYRLDNEGSSVNSGTKMFSVCTEIEEIKRYIEEHSLTEAFIEGGRFVYTYRAYMWNYYRLHIALKSAFWVEMLKEFQKLPHSKEFKETYWRKEDWLTINRILENPEMFFWNSVSELRRVNLNQYTSRDAIYKWGLMNFLAEREEIVIYGAGKYGSKLFQFIKKQGWESKIKGFAVTTKSGEQVQLEDKPIFEIAELNNQREEIVVIVAVNEAKQQVMLKNLKECGFKWIIRLDEAFLL